MPTKQMLGGVVIAVLLLAIFIVSRRKRTPPVWRVETSVHQGYAIPITSEMLDQEREDSDRVMTLLETSINESGLFRTEKIRELIYKLRSGSGAFERLNTKIAFEGNQVLSVEEKRALGLNTRMKYSKAFIEYFDPTILKTIEPKSVLEDMHLSAFHRVARTRDLLRFRESGFVTQVKIVPAGDARDCNKIKGFKKIHDLNQAPDLPLLDCTAPYCRCIYVPIVSDTIAKS